MESKIIGKLGHVSTVVGILLLTTLSNGVAQSSDGAPWEVLFNGKDLSGWTQLNGKHRWEVRDGMIVGTTVADEPNGFLCTEEEYGDFVLELEVSIDTLMNNSGVQFRNRSYPAYQNGRVHGYQMEVDPKPQQWSGAIYEEGGERHWLYSGFLLTQAAKDAFKLDNADGYQWNKYRIECIGTQIRTWVNGVPAAHLIDNRFPRGFIGLQLHANQANDPEGDYQVRFRNIRVKRVDFKPSPLDDIYVVNYLPNELSAQEEKNGVVLLWDGFSVDQWRKTSGEVLEQRYGGQESAGYLVGREDTSVLRFDSDIMVNVPYKTFELTFDFKYGESEEGGLMYLASSEVLRDVGSNALQYHIKNDGNDESLDGKYALGSLYGRLPSTKHWWFTKKPNHWNQAIIRVFPNSRVEHWLNGYLVLEYDLDGLGGRPVEGTNIALRSGVAYRSFKAKELK